jgi:hypothetical protein
MACTQTKYSILSGHSNADTQVHLFRQCTERSRSVCCPALCTANWLVTVTEYRIFIYRNHTACTLKVTLTTVLPLLTFSSCMRLDDTIFNSYTVSPVKKHFFRKWHILISWLNFQPLSKLYTDKCNVISVSWCQVMKAAQRANKGNALCILGFNSKRWVASLIWAPSNQGKQVPVPV